MQDDISLKATRLLNPDFNYMKADEKRLLAFLIYMHEDLQTTVTTGSANFMGLESEFQTETKEIYYKDFQDNGYPVESFDAIVDLCNKVSENPVTPVRGLLYYQVDVFGYLSHSMEEKRISFSFTDAFLDFLEQY